MLLITIVVALLFIGAVASGKKATQKEKDAPIRSFNLANRPAMPKAPESPKFKEIPPQFDTATIPAPISQPETRPEQKSEPRQEKAPATHIRQPRLSAKQKGNLFERFVVAKLLPSDGFTIKSWRSDKAIRVPDADGGQTLIFAEDARDPDLEVSFIKSSTSRPFTFFIECKYRSSWRGGKIDFSSCVPRYAEFAACKHRKVFLALGVGGEPSSPAELYMIPVNKYTSPIVTKDKVNMLSIDPEVRSLVGFATDMVNLALSRAKFKQ